MYCVHCCFRPFRKWQVFEYRTFFPFLFRIRQNCCTNIRDAKSTSKSQAFWLLFKYRCGMASLEDAERSGRPSTIKAYRSVTHPVSWTQDVVSITWGVVSLGPCIYKNNVTLSLLLVKTSRLHSPSAPNDNKTSLKEKWLNAARKPLNHILE